MTQKIVESKFSLEEKGFKQSISILLRNANQDFSSVLLDAIHEHGVKNILLCFQTILTR